MPTNLRSPRLPLPVSRPIHVPSVGWRSVVRLVRRTLLVVGVAAAIGLTGLVMESAGEAYARAVAGSYTHLTFSMPR